MRYVLAVFLCLAYGVMYAEEFKEEFNTLSSEHWSLDLAANGLVEMRQQEVRIENAPVLRTTKELNASSVSVEWAWADHAGTTESADAMCIILRQSKGAAILVTVQAGDGLCLVETMKGKESQKLGEQKIATRDSERYAIDVDHWQRIFVKDQDGVIKVYVFAADNDELVADPVLTVRYDKKDFPPGKIGFTNRSQMRDAAGEPGPRQESFIRRVRIKH
jgi:hypothetical protein